MKRVALIVTGDVEHKALHLSLRRIFPDVDFQPQLEDGFTSAELPAEPQINPDQPTLVEKLAKALVAAVDPGRTGTPADLAFLIDDLELFNAGVPERAVHHVRAAVRAHLDARWPSADRRQRSEALVRERCSFHLLTPMVETYFFGEPAALVRAGAKRLAQVDGQRDLEDFVTEDEDFLAPPDGKHPVWATPNRSRHPKRYVQFLCDPTGANWRAYRETKEGVGALRELDWPAILGPPFNVRFARAFLMDLAEGLDRPDVVARLGGQPHELTSRNHRDNLLRNI